MAAPKLNQSPSLPSPIALNTLEKVSAYAIVLIQSLVAIFQSYASTINQIITDETTDATNIATNTANIATNTANIASSTTNISTLQGQTAGYESAWSTFTPTVVPNGGGTFTSAAASMRYKQNGKTVLLQLNFTITTVGTATGYPTFTLPVTPKAGSVYALIGREKLVTGKSVVGTINELSNLLLLDYYDNSGPIAAGTNFSLSGVYEAN